MTLYISKASYETWSGNVILGPILATIENVVLPIYYPTPVPFTHVHLAQPLSLTPGDLYAIWSSDFGIGIYVNQGTSYPGGWTFWGGQYQGQWDGVFRTYYSMESDADEDGVSDELDQCPETTLGDPVDANGCSDAQVDFDGDGYCDPEALSIGPSACTGSDNCPEMANMGQSNIDGDVAGDVCDVCPADETDGCDQSGSAAKEIPAAEGGSVATSDGQLEIIIDPGDLAADTTISITQTADPDPEVNLRTATGPGIGKTIALYDLEPDGMTFSDDVELKIVLDVTDLNAKQREKLDLYRYEDTNGDSIPDTFVSLGASCSMVEDPPGTIVATCTALVDHFSTYAILVPLDSDDDGVPNDFEGQTDMCPETVIPEAAPTSGTLRYNRWALMDDDGGFDTNQPPGGGTSASFTIEDTAGCSCEQIIDELGLGKNHLKNGCSTSAMIQWVEMADSP